MIKKTAIFKLQDLGPLELIKVGGQAKIFQAVSLISEINQLVIIKIYEKDHRSRQSFTVEHQVLKEANHPGIIGFLGVMDHLDGPSLVLKKPSDVNLSLIINWFKIHGLRCPTQVIYYIFCQLLKALNYLHSMFNFSGVIHGDISSANIVFSTSGDCHLIDFGAAFLGPQRIEAAFGIKKYLAPEHLEGFVSFYSDLYSLAAVMFELALLRPFNLDSMGKDFKELSLYLNQSDLFFFLRACLAPSPMLRPKSAAHILENLSIKDHKKAKNYLTKIIKALSLTNR